MAPARKTSTNVYDLNSRLPGSASPFLVAHSTYHSTRLGLCVGTRSSISQAAGRPVTSVVAPRRRNAQAGLSLLMTASRPKLMAAPPKPPPAKMRPLASPRLALNHCAVTVEMTYTARLLSPLDTTMPLSDVKLTK